MRKPISTSLAVCSVLASVAVCLTEVRADLTLPHVFGDSMVLQRDARVPVWGWADAGDTVTVSFAGQTKAAKAGADGKWRVALDPMPSSAEPATMAVSAKTGGQKLDMANVLVGEVWVCSGQSNMQWSVRQSLRAEEELAAANYPRIRHIAIPRVPQSAPADDVNAAWTTCSPETVSGFTACGYFFGRDLHKELDVPIGLINSSWGGTRIEPWTPPIGFAQVSELADIHEKIMLTNPASDAYKKALGEYVDAVDAWLKTARQAVADKAPLTPSPVYPQQLTPMTDHQQPTTLYNGMIHPLVPFAIRGAIWYQGESNHTEGKLYTAKMKALINGWRDVWAQERLPFYYVQIAPYKYGNESPFVLAEFWEAQIAALGMPDTGMVVTNDIGNVNDIHPKNKQEVGRRLALLALANTYGREGLVCDGPVYKAMAIEGSTIRVRFDNAASGLASRDGKPLTGFEIIGKKTEFVKAEATIEGDSLVLSSPEVKEPVAIRFAWHKEAEPNLMNKEGLPARPFRAGTPPVHDYLAMNVPEADKYQLVYDLDLAKLGKDIRYDQDLRSRVAGPFKRIAYFLELRKPGSPVQWVYVSMDAFTDDVGKIGIPSLASKANFQKGVANLNVLSNVDGIVTGEGLSGGNIEFWPNNYSHQNTTKVPNASNDLWDFGDQCVDPVDGYGCMQVHNHEAKQTIFAINMWKGGQNADIGIGNSNSDARTRDWTFTKAGNQYHVKRLRVLVLP